MFYSMLNKQFHLSQNKLKTLQYLQNNLQLQRTFETILNTHFRYTSIVDLAQIDILAQIPDNYRLIECSRDFFFFFFLNIF